MADYNQQATLPAGLLQPSFDFPHSIFKIGHMLAMATQRAAESIAGKCLASPGSPGMSLWRCNAKISTRCGAGIATLRSVAYRGIVFFTIDQVSGRCSLAELL